MAVIGGRTLLAGAAFLAATVNSPRAEDAAARFVEAAYASAQFQLRISSIAATKETTPGIRSLAERIRDFRAAQLPELNRLAATVGVIVRDTLDLELT